ncbi:putative chromosome-partitioning protein ParB [Clostridium acetireducens DSM 10703]|uniref:Putative chromosome-partitioning protein ParB n=1 Tax=Clostridium acetireducens DSM 10703 TaxID=1121290 RepID=A0A1E8EXW8_9CLOT|nr:ParB/RepB/Spo0J family partition protein [Clostridium acetireducens]OFI05390.1 putative chromosome-partitioning protein ParB [Clostridium acetireducens DSM 10703]
MSKKKYGLGKGLSALIPDSNMINEEYSEEKNVYNISVDLISANEDQPRKIFNKEKILELSQSIKEHGVIQPLVLNKNKKNKTYTIIAGERRWRAAKLAGIKEIPAIIMDLSDREIVEVSLIENIQREDLNPIEEASAYKKLIEDFNLTQDILAQKISKSRTSITNKIRLLKLDEKLQNYLMEGSITEGHARALLSIEDKKLQCEICKLIIEKSLSVRDTEKLIKNLYKKSNKNDRITEDNIFYNEIKNKLENLLGTKVFLKDKKNKGKIEIEYYSQEDLQRILDILNIY